MWSERSDLSTRVSFMIGVKRSVDLRRRLYSRRSREFALQNLQNHTRLVNMCSVRIQCLQFVKPSVPKLSYRYKCLVGLWRWPLDRLRRQSSMYLRAVTTTCEDGMTKLTTPSYILWLWLSRPGDLDLLPLNLETVSWLTIRISFTAKFAFAMPFCWSFISSAEGEQCWTCDL